jgi:hypothetical protein
MGKKNKGLSFHSFATDSDQRKSWLIAIKNGKKPSVHAKVCSRHLSCDQFFAKKYGKYQKFCFTYGFVVIMEYRYT